MALAATEQLFTSPPEDPTLQLQALRQVAAAAQELLATDPNSTDLHLIAQKTADAAREDRWRLPLGESGLLQFFCGLVGSEGLRPTLAIQVLRVIGNSCADQDENRERVVATGCLPKIVLLLNDDSLLPYVIPVLFNVCVDYKPAQQAIYKAGINPELVSLISSPRLAKVESYMSYICKILRFVASEEPEANLVHPATPFVLLKQASEQVPTDPDDDIEDFLGPVSAALTYLSQEQFQQSFLETPNAVPLLLDAVARACQSLSAAPEVDIDDDDRAQLAKVQAAFTATLADLSAHPLFSERCPLDGAEARTLRAWLEQSNAPVALQSAACLALGNVARSDEVCTYLVQKSGIHEPLSNILADPATTDAGLLHAVLSFLKNLSIPPANKPVIGKRLFEPHRLPRVWDTTTTQPQVQFDAVSLARLLLVQCVDNVRLIVAGKEPLIASLLALHSSADQEPTKMETARAGAAVCRVLHTDASAVFPDGGEEKLQEFYARHGAALASALLFLVTQPKFAALRSETLFVLALAARSAAGAGMVARGIPEHDNAVDALGEVISGQKPTADDGTSNRIEELQDDESGVQVLQAGGDGSSLPDLSGLGLEAKAPQGGAGAQRSATASVDRENALVLIAELLKACPGELGPRAQETFGRLLKEGGAKVAMERAGRS
ncbi:armadillo-type protein [Xylariomycetidae sp. FL0641]|nr:armadillo-type protein [Xylariomycetidae sp. FL0641]